MKTALTIGFFDGVHLGHQALLKILRAHPHTTILTFSNHPQSILNPPAPEPILPLEEKLRLLKPFADELIVLPFTLETAETPFDQFLSPFTISHLILGAGSAFGKNREGNEINVRKYAEKLNICVEYIPKVLFHDELISSSRIRSLIKNKNYPLAQQLLGRS